MILPRLEGQFRPEEVRTSGRLAVRKRRCHSPSDKARKAEKVVQKACADARPGRIVMASSCYCWRVVALGGEGGVTPVGSKRPRLCGPRRRVEKLNRLSTLNLTNNLLLAIRRLRPYTPCKKWEEAVVSVMLFWGVGIAILGWLVFKIAERM